MESTTHVTAGAEGNPTTAATILAVLGAAGVKTIFGVPGVHNRAFWGPTAGTPRIVEARSERAAGHAADGYARASGRLGVAIVASGPSASSAVTAFGEAWASGSPVLLIGSEPPAARRRPGQVRGLLHEMADQSVLFAQMAKAVYHASSSLAAVEAVTRAAATAMTSPRGPVYVGIPADVLVERIPAHLTVPPKVTSPRAVGPSPAGLEAALDLLASSRRPVLWIGGGAVQSEAAGPAADLAWRLGAPVVATLAARGVLPTGHPLLVDAPVHEAEVAALLSEADLVLALGTAFEGPTTNDWTVSVPDQILSVNTNPEHLDRGYPAQVALIADVALVCERLAVRLPARQPWADSVFRIGPAVRGRLANDVRTRPIVDLLASVESAWPTESPIVCDMSVAGFWIGGYAARSLPRTLEAPVGWGTAGFALPAAAGAALAARDIRPARPTRDRPNERGPGGRPRRRVLAVLGDRAAAMDAGELATLVQEDLDVTVLVVEDGGHDLLRDGSFGLEPSGADQPLQSDLIGPDWLAVAAAYGIPAEEVSDPGPALRDALERAVVATGPRFVLLRYRFTPPRNGSPIG